MKRSLKNRNMPIISGRGYYGNKLDGQLCFELWLDLGTAGKATAALKRKGLKSYTGNPYSHASVALAAKKYILFNQKTCRIAWEEHYDGMDDEIWYGYLLRISNILGTYCGTTIDQWWKDNPEVAEYKKSLE